MSEYGYIPEAPEQSFGNNKGIFTPKDIYDLTRADKYTNYGQLELIETQTASADNIVDFTDIKEDVYNVHFVTVNVDLSNTSSVQIRFFESGVLETASVYATVYQNGQATGSFSETSAGNNRIFATRTGGTDEARQAYNYLYNLGDSTKYSFQTMQGVSRQSPTTALDMRYGTGALLQASTVNGIRFTETGGGLLTGTISLYGMRTYQ